MAAEEGDDEGDGFSHFGQEPAFVPMQPQPFVPRDKNPARPPARGPALPAARPAASASRASSAPQFQPQPQPQPQPAVPDNVSVDRLPSFITGPQPQISGGPGGFEGNGGGERYPRRRRRPHGPRPDGMAPAPAGPGSDDFNPGNE